MENKHKSNWKHLDFILMDYLVVEISYFIAQFWYDVQFNRIVPYMNRPRIEAIVLAFAVTITLVISNPYVGILKRNRYQEMAAVFTHTLQLAMTEIILLFIMHISGFSSRLITGYTWIIYFILECTCRLLWKRMLKHYILPGRSSKNALVLITNQKNVNMMIENLAVEQWQNFFIKGVFLTDYQPNDSNIVQSQIPVLGKACDAPAYAAHNWVDDVMINLPDDPKEADVIGEHFEKMGITTHYTVLALNESNGYDANYVEKIGNYITVTASIRNISPIQWIGKRILDIVGALIGLACTGIIFLFVAPAIYKADKGPVFYASTRIGKNGRQFKMWKFRSMYQDADARKQELMKENKMNGLMFKMDNDPRILPGVGTFIRKTSLDEFPQFWNVLKGDMSLVGTRPPTIDEWQHYTERHRIRMVMKPGITGLWQISGRSEITDFNQVVKLDEKYIETWTVWMDIQILFKTVFKVIKREGAE